MNAEFPTHSYYAPEIWSVVQVKGAEAATFLNGFCSNDILGLKHDDACEAFFTDMKARVLAYGWVGRNEAGCMIVLSSPEAEALRKHLDKYVLTAAVELVVDEQAQVMIYGSEPETSLSQEGVLLPLRALGDQVIAYVGQAPPPSNWSLLTSEEFESIRIRRGVPKDRVDVDERNLPQEVDRDAMAISFNKGCYLGQEPVARIDAMGHVNWLLRGLRFSKPSVTPGESLQLEDKVVGRVTSVAGDLGLGYVRREVANAGQTLEHPLGSVTVCEFPVKN